MEFHCESAAAALEKCLELVREGRADLFRGQTRDWPKLIPSLFRASGEQRAEAAKELEYFKEWARFVPQMTIYEGDDDPLTAIAQHYGIPTPLLDLTRNPEIAILFAKQSAHVETPPPAVIYCFLEAALTRLPGSRLTSISVDNLWRLEAQEGLFLHYLDYSLADTLRQQAIRIYFPSTDLAAEERTQLYPSRKSALEIAIDQWIYRREVERLVEMVSANATFTSMTHRQTYPGAFRWRSLPQLQGSWIRHQVAWVFPPIESVAVTKDPAVIVLPQVDLSDPLVAKDALIDVVRGPIGQYAATGQLVSFQVQLSRKRTKLSGSVATLINRCWDGLRVLPYDLEEVIAAVATTAVFLLARAEGIKGVDEWPERLFGELAVIEVAPIGGHIEAGAVSRAKLREAFSGEHLARMTDYMRRVATADPEQLMLYVVDHWMIFRFDAFKSLFVEQLVPTMVDSYWKEDLSLYKGSLGCIWGINFNPALLGYVTPFSFRFLSPVAMLKDCDPVVFIAPDMERSDLEELFISCMPSIEGGGQPFQVTFNDYTMDPRPIWEIDRVVQQCQWIVDVGGISALEVFPGLLPESCEAQGRMPVGIGAFEIWLIAQRRIPEVQGRPLDHEGPLFQKFWEELMISNANLETRAKSAPDWPGPIANRTS